MRTSAIVGVARRIVEMKGEPQYAGKIGKVDFSVKPEDLIIDNGEDVDDAEFRFLGAIDCKKCPAKETCTVDYWKGCGDNFIEWAKSEAK